VRKAYLLVLTLFVIIAAGMLAPTLVMAQYSTTATAPIIAVKLPNGTQDMNVTDTHPYAIGDSYNVTLWINDVTNLDSFGLTIFWNADLCYMTNFYWSPTILTTSSWVSSPVTWSNNATTMPLEPWTGKIPINIGLLDDIGAGTESDKAPLTGNIMICTLTFKILTLGVHWYYIMKDPSNYGTNTANWPMPQLAIEAEYPPSISFPYCGVAVTPYATAVNYTVAWCKNPYFALPNATNPSMPYSGHVMNAVLTTTTTIIPEFPAFMPLLLFLIATIIAVAVAKIMWTKKPKGHVNVK
jgi:hypothetical protein